MNNSRRKRSPLFDGAKHTSTGELALLLLIRRCERIVAGQAGKTPEVMVGSVHFCPMRTGECTDLRIRNDHLALRRSSINRPFSARNLSASSLSVVRIRGILVHLLWDVNAPYFACVVTSAVTSAY